MFQHQQHLVVGSPVELLVELQVDLQGELLVERLVILIKCPPPR